LTAKLKLKISIQQDNDPKHSRKSPTECQEEKRIEVLLESSQSPDINLIEMLWWDLRDLCKMNGHKAQLIEATL